MKMIALLDISTNEVLDVTEQGFYLLFRRCLFIIFCNSLLIQINIENAHAQNVKLPNSLAQNHLETTKKDMVSDHPEIPIGVYELIKNYLTSGQDHENLDKSRKIFSHLQSDRLCYFMASNNKFFFGKLAILLLTNSWHNDQYHKHFIQDYLRLIIAHEVGHTLGLRHNFRGSNYLSPEELNNPEITKNKGLTASIMDYVPPNIARYGTKQGDYFPKMVGPYDQWAIEYGYTPSNSQNTMGEKPFLNSIAARSNQQELSYATDEDVTNNDPTVSPWDHSNNVLVYAENQLANSRLMWSKLDQYSRNLQSYSDVSAKFMRILINYSDNLNYTTKYIGGQSFYRLKPGDNQGQSPFVIVPITEQRQALKNLQKYVFAEDAFNFSLQLLNQLTPSRWGHWGSKIPQGRLDYPVHDLVLDMQTMVLNDLLSGDRLRLLKDLEFKNPPGQTLTLSELFNTLLTGIWTEILQPQGKVKISSLRRGLQRKHLEILAAMILRKKPVPEDARTLAWYQLKKLNQQLKRVSSDDQYTQAFLLETSDRIHKILSYSLVAN
ncbi:zinc-dependent metalloprotease [Anabaena sp. FACHB-1237]|uniref:zinc-dependent metalloprotease n=1 Tax=Anabaena sp. FACHB-1237 TaxID=2692769 RepID=UPI00168046D7|nr:zinc-dependent metalloprotease [Anabaena sp. FACHB-1237]MBD2136397.1 zinc-dependent metalloprotease [Anabaena sp. FACHB-1237]